mmetsp:Transcript_11559/g.14402  ORF Transcript_11559/g.14402 Transcript_11559/m.14402 type:complete len:105 (-) Transcript_11559:715-1029(-)
MLSESKNTCATNSTTTAGQIVVDYVSPSFFITLNHMFFWFKFCLNKSSVRKFNKISIVFQKRLFHNHAVVGFGTTAPTLRGALRPALKKYKKANTISDTGSAVT